MGKYFVEPDTISLDLSDGNWIEVKTELSFGEEQRIVGKVLAARTSDDGTVWQSYKVLGFLTWIVDWSLTDSEDKPVSVSKSAIENLRGPIAEEIDTVLNAHIEKVRDAASDEKKRRGVASTG